MIRVPGGAFVMGCVDADVECLPWEKPAHRVDLSTFWMDEHPVTNSEYALCIAGGHCKKPDEEREALEAGFTRNYEGISRADYPVIGVSWTDAAAYCRWAKKRLPTEAEYEYALRGGREGEIYPWGNGKTPPKRAGNYADESLARLKPRPGWIFPETFEGYDDGFPGPSPVCAFARNAYGLCDIDGDVFEWCADWSAEDYYAWSPTADPEGPTSGKSRVVRGGSWNHDSELVRSSSRKRGFPDEASPSTGFRCARDGDMFDRVRGSSTGAAEAPPAAVAIVDKSKAICSPAGWCWENPLPQGNNLNSVWGESPSDVFAVGGYGTILHFDGSAWSAMKGETRDELHRVWGASVSDVYTVGGETILHYDGNSWSKLTPNHDRKIRVKGDLAGVWGDASNDLFVVGPYGEIYHIERASWRRIKEARTLEWAVESELFSSAAGRNHYAFRLFGVWGTPAMDVYAVGEISASHSAARGLILRYQESKWFVVECETAGQIRSLWGTSPSNIVAVGAQGTVLHFDGKNWAKMPTPTDAQLNDIWGSSPTDVFVVGNGGAILHGDGRKWTPMNGTRKENLAGVWGSSIKDVFAVGDAGVILHYDGAAWTEMSKHVTTATLSAVWASSPNDIYAAAKNDGLLHYDGKAWTQLAPGADAVWNALWGASGADVFVGGQTLPGEQKQGGVISRYDGSAWRRAASDAGAFVEALWGASPSDVFAAGKQAPEARGEILRYDGAEWAPTNNGGAMDIRSLWGFARSDVFAVGNDYRGGLIAHFDGSAWSMMNDKVRTSFMEGKAGANVLDDFRLHGVWGASRENLFAVGGDLRTRQDVGVILRYDGKQWLPVMEGVRAMARGIWGSSSSSAFVVGENGLIVEYDGAYWREMESGTARSLLAVTGTSAGDVYAVGEGGAVLHFGGKPPIVK
jgi:formylglycine-generating enzyme required for sulfatase activity